jgi:DNA-binding transcriptional LysR family regulator
LAEAAVELRVTQQQVNKLIKRFKLELGMRLLTPPTVTGLTEAGAITGRCQRWRVTRLEDTLASIHNAQAGIAGTIAGG